MFGNVFITQPNGPIFVTYCTTLLNNRKNKNASNAEQRLRGILRFSEFLPYKNPLVTIEINHRSTFPSRIIAFDIA